MTAYVLGCGEVRSRERRARACAVVRRRGAVLACRRPPWDDPPRLPGGVDDDGEAHSFAGADTSAQRATFGYVGGEKIGLAFTCARCDTRSVKLISRRAYSDGVVLVQCSGCGARHIVADNLGWYAELTGGRSNIEELAAARNIPVAKISGDVFELERRLYDASAGENAANGGDARGDDAEPPPHVTSGTDDTEE